MGGLLLKRRRSPEDDGDDGDKQQSSSCSVGVPQQRTIKSTNKLYQPGYKLVVQRAAILPGLSVPSLAKPFQRPMLGRRAYNKQADAALAQSSLGQRRRFDGMSKLLARAGKGLSYKLPTRRGDDDDGGSTGSSSDSDDDDDDDKIQPQHNMEPLQVWTSPHQGGEAVGLPSQL